LELSDLQRELLVTIADSIPLYYARHSTPEEKRDLEVLHEFGYIIETKSRQYKLLPQAVTYLSNQNLRPEILQVIFDFFQETKDQSKEEWTATEIDEFRSNHQLEEKTLYWGFWIAEGLRFVKLTTGLGRLLPFYIQIKPLGIDFANEPEKYFRTNSENEETSLLTIGESINEIRDNLLRTPQSKLVWLLIIIVIPIWISFLGGSFLYLFVNPFNLENSLYLVIFIFFIVTLIVTLLLVMIIGIRKLKK